MNQFLLPKNHIVNIAYMEEFQCTICYSIETDLVKCKGPCKGIFCLHCVTRFKIKSNQCPNRCTNPWQLQKIPNLSIKFKCPYDDKKCKQIFHGADQFYEHLQTCDFIFKQIGEEIKNKRQFVCPKSHSLLFLNPTTFYQIYKHNNFYQTTLNETCKLCSCQTVCTSICKQCSTQQQKCVFCIKCRALPCTKTKCPVGHPYIIRNSALNSTVCDFCGLAISIFGLKSFRDQNCNFDICQSCHDKLPETHPLVPLNQTVLPKKKSFLQQLLNNVLHAAHMNHSEDQLSSDQEGFEHQNQEQVQNIQNQEQNFQFQQHNEEQI